MPEEMANKRQVDMLTNLMEDCVRHGYSTEEFLERAHRQLNFEEELTETSLATLFEKIVSLENEGRNGIWTRILKNAFAPLFVGRFDYVAGNPPWVNWESLADEYRQATQDLWQNMDFSPLKEWRLAWAVARRMWLCSCFTPL
jgi:hypothetical protein